MVSAQNNYAFPNISFSESIVGPPPANSNWRNNVGVAGVFRRGPRGATRINSRQEFAALYGEDNSPGSIAVRQLFLQGATNIVVSRAAPIPSKATGEIEIAGVLSNQEARVGYVGNVAEYDGSGNPVKTTGLELELSYVGRAFETDPLAGRLKVKTNSKLASTYTYEGKGAIDFVVEEYLEGAQRLVVDTAYTGYSLSYTAGADATLVTGSTGLFADLALTGSPTIANGDIFRFASGVVITATSGTAFTVNTGGVIQSGDVVYKARTLAVETVSSAIPANSTLTAPGYVFITLLDTAIDLTGPVSIPVVAIATSGTGSAPTLAIGAVVNSNSRIHTGATVSLTTASAATDYSWVTVSATSANAGLIANVKPGRWLVLDASTTNAVSFKYLDSDSTTYSALLILGYPIQTAANTYKFLVRGSINKSTASELVELHETPESVYLLSTRYIPSDERAFSFSHLSKAYTHMTGQMVNPSGTIVDNYIIVREGYASAGYNHKFFFEESTDVRGIDSGINLDIPVLEGVGKVAFLEGSVYRVPFARSSVKLGKASASGVDFATGLTASSLAEEIRTAALSNSIIADLIDEVEISSALLPVTIKLTSKFTGLDANRIYYTIKRKVTPVSATPSDLIFKTAGATLTFTSNATAATALAGGERGSNAAFHDLYDAAGNPLVRIFARSDGAYGNKIKFSVTPGARGEFSLYVVDEDSVNYQAQASAEVLNLSTREVDKTSGIFFSSINSKLVRVYYLPYVSGKTNLSESELDRVPMRIAPVLDSRNSAIDSTFNPYSRAYQGASYMKDIYLFGGYDGNTTSVSALEASLVNAVSALEAEDVAILCCAGVTVGDERFSQVIEEIVGQVRRATPTTGIRHAVLQAPRRLTAVQAKVLGASIANPNITIVAGYCTMAGVPGYNSTPCDGLYAGLLSVRPPYVSPASASEGFIPAGVTSVDTPSAPDYLDELTRAGIEVLYYDAGLRTFKFLNGISTSRDRQDRYVSIRRVSNQILHDLYRNLIWVRSAKNTAGLRLRVANAVDAYLQQMVRDGAIASFRPTLCGDTNNTQQTIAQGELNIAIYYTPHFPADYIRVGVTREVTETLTIQTQ